MVSVMIPSVFNLNASCPSQGFVYAFGSSNVKLKTNVSGSTRLMRSMMWRSSVCGWPMGSSHVESLKPTESTTSVSPSHLPTDSPNHEMSGTSEWGRLRAICRQDLLYSQI